MLAEGTINSFEFEVAPANAEFICSFDSACSNLSVDIIIQNDVIFSNENTCVPSNYHLFKVEPVFDDMGGAISGRYRAFIQDNSLSKNYNDNICLKYAVENRGRESIVVKSNPINIIYDETPKIPIVVIDTPDKQDIISKIYWTEGAKMKIVMPDGTLDYEGNISIRGRGNTTWIFPPKKPYAIKLDKKDEILGMPKHKRWCLLANAYDRTSLRNSFAFEISKQMGFEWTPRGQHVEVVLNRENIGLYYLCEQIKVDKNRLNINEMATNSDEEDDVSGGFLMEVDNNFDELNKFRSAVRNLPYMFKYPDEEDLSPRQFNYMQDYINNLEILLYNTEKLSLHEYQKYLDIESFADYWILYELTENNEPINPRSCYMYKDKGKKLKMGPVWDFDGWGTFSIRTEQSFLCDTAVYYGQLFKDPQFVDKVKERWRRNKSNLRSLTQIIRFLAEKIKLSEAKNAIMWPFSWQTQPTNGDEDLLSEQAVDRMIQAYMRRLNWLDEEIEKMQ